MYAGMTVWYCVMGCVHYGHYGDALVYDSVNVTLHSACQRYSIRLLRVAPIVQSLFLLHLCACLEHYTLQGQLPRAICGIRKQQRHYQKPAVYVIQESMCL